MDAPRIQYAKTDDGVSIAFATEGKGPPIVLPPLLIGDNLGAPGPALKRGIEQLAEHCTVVRYNCRGMGMSQRDAIDFSVEAACRDLEAVVNRLGFEHFSIWMNRFTGGFPIAFTALNPERVSHLIIHHLMVRRLTDDQAQQLRDASYLLERNFPLYLQIASRVNTGWRSPYAVDIAEAAAGAHTPRSMIEANRAISSVRRTMEAYAPRVKTPTLVIYLSADPTGARDAGETASLIETATVVGVPGPVGSDNNDVWNALTVQLALDFIHQTRGAPTAVPSFDTGAFRTILFTDLEAHTAMMQRLGDAKGREVLREHERISREALRAHGGTEVKTIGDSFMASFPSAQKAIECAIALQRAFNSTEAAGERLRIRVGINAGEPIAEEDDLFGASVILASRAKEKAAGGEIFVTDVVRQLVAGKGFGFTDHGEMEMKGFEEPVRLYEVSWQSAA
jgi:class 3 adenylate cyclase/pimeloyl-ACP methyl ester carboxylesterase